MRKLNVKTALSKWRRRVAFSKAKTPTMEALRIVAGVLNEVATMTQSVPYVQTLSSLITYVVSVNDDMDSLKSERELLRQKFLHLQSIIDETERRLGPNDDLPVDLQEPFRMLESVLKQVVVVLEKCVATEGPLGKAKHLVSRKDLIKKIEVCDENLNAALTCFNTTLQILQSLDIKEIKTDFGKKFDSMTIAVEAVVVEVRSQKDGKANIATITSVIAVQFFF